MPVNSLNTGRDYTFGYFDANTGQVVDFGDIQSFAVTSGKHMIVSRPYNGLPKFGFIPDGFHGTFRIVRTKSAVEDLQITLAALFNTGGNVQPGFISFTVNNPDGSVSRRQFTGCCFWLDEVASGSRESTVAQSVEWYASDQVTIT